MTTSDDVKPIELGTVAKAMRRAAHLQWQLTLAGTKANITETAYWTMSNPKIGDWVIEASTIYMRSRRDIDAVGILEKIEMEPCMSEAEWNVELNGPVSLECCWYIRTIDGRLFRWTNAQIIALAMEQ